MTCPSLFHVLLMELEKERHYGIAMRTFVFGRGIILKKKIIISNN